MIVAAVTSNLRLADAPGNVLVNATDAGLDRAFVINVTQVAWVDRSVLESRIGVLPAERTQALDAGLRLVLRL